MTDLIDLAGKSVIVTGASMHGPLDQVDLAEFGQV
jgi:hypothetical protein